MKLFLLFSELWSKKFFYKIFLNFANEFKTGFENRKWNYLNRKWNYFSYFLTSNQKTYFKKVSTFSKRIQNWFWKQEMEISKQEMELNCEQHKPSVQRQFFDQRSGNRRNDSISCLDISISCLEKLDLDFSVKVVNILLKKFFNIRSGNRSNWAGWL